MMRFYLERYDEGGDPKKREGKWISLPMDQDKLDKILEELGVVAEDGNFIINNLEDEQIKNLQPYLFVEDFSEMNNLASVLETLDESEVEIINKHIEHHGEIDIPEFLEFIEKL